MVALAYAMGFAYSRDARVAALAGLLVVAGRVAYRYARPAQVKNPLGAEPTAVFALGLLGAAGLSTYLRGHPALARWGLYLSLYYAVGSLVEYGIHKYVMHCYTFAPWMMRKDAPACLRRTCLAHLSHHNSVQTDMGLSEVRDEHELVFSWPLTATLGVGVGALMWAVTLAAGLRIPGRTHAALTAALVVGFSIVWNTVHPTMHRHELSGKVPMPPALPYKLRGGLWYDNHAIHHEIKGEHKGNYNVVYLGADEILGANRLGERVDRAVK